MKNNTIKIVILGGYGITGSMIARLLMQSSSAHLILAGRDEAKAKETAALLTRNSAASGQKGSMPMPPTSPL